MKKIMKEIRKGMISKLLISSASFVFMNIAVCSTSKCSFGLIYEERQPEALERFINSKKK